MMIPLPTQPVAYCIRSLRSMSPSWWRRRLILTRYPSFSPVTTKLASPDVEYLDSVVTLDEYSEALRSLQPGKSPGSDGLPAEFYKRFCDVLGSDLAEVLVLTSTTNNLLLVVALYNQLV